MSHLDLSMSFSNLVGLLICFSIFIYYITMVVIQSWYNVKLSNLDGEEISKELVKMDSSVTMKSILKL